ncbi:MAG: acyltransferase [Victivallaceae bacterium]|nr:acyltransferase [Victivallaceae bacterium]
MIDIRENSSNGRNNGIDLLRLFSMFLVVVLHIAGYGGIGNERCAFLLCAISGCAVNCFAMISGYVGCMSAQLKPSKILALWCQVVYYSLLIAVIMPLFSTGGNWHGLWKYLFPILSCEYWYFNAYVIVFAAMPLLNTAIRNTDARNLFYSLIVLFIFFCIVPMFFWKTSTFFEQRHGYNALWLGYCYLVGGFFRKYRLPVRWSWRGNLLGYCIMVALCCVWRETLMQLHHPLGSTSCLMYISPMMFLGAIFLLLAFAEMPIAGNGGWGRFAQIFSPSAFAVYLIHVHPIVWELGSNGKRFSFLASLTPIALFLTVLFLAFLIFIVCLLLDFPRRWIFEKLSLQRRCGFADHLIK